MHVTCLPSTVCARVCVCVCVFVCSRRQQWGRDPLMKKGYFGNSLIIGALKGAHF